MKYIYFSILIASICVIFSACTSTPSSKPGIYINEFLCSNSGINTEPLLHEHADWIELYNGYDSLVDLSGYFLSNKKNNTTKWEIPSGTTIASNSHLIIWADNRDTSLHTNFRLNRVDGNIALYSKERKLLNEVSYPIQDVNVSYGRKNDGAEQWQYFDTPTPNFSNNKQIGVDSLNCSAKPKFSINGGFYSKKQSISLSTTKTECEIRYTLDGSIPSRSSKLYKSPLNIDITSVVRAISIEKGKLSSSTVTNTYFINVQKEGAIVSLVSDPIALWDKKSGAYKNSLQNIRRLANLEFFENQKVVINQEVDFKISGNIAKFFDQKAILLEAKGKYGKTTLNHQFFPEKKVYNFQSILLRAGGHPDKYHTMFRDGLGLHLSDEHVDIDHSGYRPVIVYLNGKYWGYYNIREKTNSSFIINNHNLRKDQFDLLKNTWLDVISGDRKHYKKTLNFITQCDKTKSNNYQRVKELIDIDNYINYTISELYVANIDWPNWNIKFWRERKEGAKWKWILVDLDYGLGSGANVNFNMIEFATSPVKTLKKNTNPPAATLLFRKMLEFPEFKNEFIQRFAVSLNVIYSSERVLGIIKKFKDQRSKEMPFQIDRWKDSYYDSPWHTSFQFKIPSSIKHWDNEIETIRNFARKRPDIVRNNLMAKFKIKESVQIKTISSGGHIAINTIDLYEGVLEADYFKGIPMNIEAIPNPGEKFLYWIVNNKKLQSKSLKYMPVSDGTIIAVFEKII